MNKTILILGGTSDAIKLAAMMVKKHPHWRIISSLAGRTGNPAPIKGEVRIGGFGGVTGLVEYIRKNHIEDIFDATHPFANAITKNAKEAARQCGIDYQSINRPEWVKQPGDMWIDVSSIEDASIKLPQKARVFLALGSQYINGFAKSGHCHFIVRMINQPAEPLILNSYQLILGKPLKEPKDELALLQKFNITHLVTRNSGGDKSYAKIIAARKARIPVLMIKRPQD